MKKKKLLIITLVFILLLIPVTNITVFADVGGGVDWDAGGGSGGGYTGGGYTGGWGGSNMFFFFPYLFRNPILLIAFLLFMYFARKRSGNSRNNRSNYDQRTQPYQQQRPQQPRTKDISDFPEDQNLNQLMQRDSMFSKNIFLSRVSSIFITLQEAWTNKDWHSIRTFETDQLFHQHEMQLNDFIEKNQTNVVEEISILDSKIEKYYEDATNSYIDAILKARYRDYVVDDNTGKVIKGDKSKRYIMTYRMTFLRKLDAETSTSDSAHVTKCPNCGANLSINQNGICEYCGSEVTTGAQQWVLSKLQPLAQEVLE